MKTWWEIAASTHDAGAPTDYLCCIQHWSVQMSLRPLAAAAFGLSLAATTASGQDLEDRRAVIAVADTLDTAVDAKDWETAQSLFAEAIRVKLPGQDEVEMPSAELVGTWARFLHEDKISFHLRGNHLVRFEGADAATVISKGYAWNLVEGLEGGELWEVWGDYSYDLVRTQEGWVLTRFAFAPLHQRGNGAVPGHLPEG